MKKNKTMDEELQLACEYEGCCRVIAALMRQTYKDYKYALIYTYMHKKEYEQYKPFVLEYDAYLADLYKYNVVSTRKTIKPETQKFIDEFLKRTPVPKPNDEMMNLVKKYNRQKSIQVECESFYMGEDFKIFTQNKSLPGIEVIKIIRARAARYIRKKLQEEALKNWQEIY